MYLNKYRNKIIFLFMYLIRDEKKEVRLREREKKDGVVFE